MEDVPRQTFECDAHKVIPNSATHAKCDHDPDKLVPCFLAHLGVFEPYGKFISVRLML
jgi:hypothetical protein